MAKKLIVEIVGDSRSYERALKKSATATNQFGTAVGTTAPRIGKLQSTMAATGYGAIGLAGAVGGLAVVLGGKSVAAASDLNEQISRTEVVLGQSADEMIKWSETTATSMGISQRAALAAAGTFAGLFQTVGVQQQKAADLSQSLVQLAADLASLQNSSPEEALIALRSGLAGEAEPLRRFNIFLTEARVNLQALAETGKDNVKSLTQQEKTLARYSLILKDSTLAQGNFALTSGELANQQRILRAQVDNLSTQLGQVLVPALTGVVGALNDAISAGKDLKAVWDTLAGLPGIEIPVKFVSEHAGGRGGDVLRHIVLGQVSPLALGITIGKEISDGVRQGFDIEAVLGVEGGVQPGVGGAQRAAARGQRAAAEAAEKQAAAAAKQGQAIIDQIVRQGTAQKSLNQQMAESEQRAAHLKDLIRADPENVKLQQRLTAEYKKQSSLKAEQVALGKQNAATAKATAVAAKAEAAAIAEARREREKAAREAKREQVQRNLFKDLGLTGEGDQPTPGSGALINRAQSMLDNLKLTEKNRQKLKTIVAVLKKNYKTAGQEVRAAILGMLNDISSAGKDKKDKEAGWVGEITKGSIRSTQMLTRGLGLTEEQREAIKKRNLGVSGRRGFGSFGFAQSSGVPRGGLGGRDQGPPQPIIIKLQMDGKEISQVVLKDLQTRGARFAGSRRGRHGGVKQGLG